VVWVAVFWSDILPVSSGGCLKNEGVCLFRTASIPDGLVSACKTTISVLYDLNDVMKWNRGGLWYGIVVL
jgi:hypothetical protein